MRRFTAVAVACMLVGLVLAACDVPTPPPELPTATPGSLNPENPAVRANLTQVPLATPRGFAPLSAPPGHIYFVRDSKLWRISPDGTGETQLSDLPVTNAPQPSPDGSMVAFTSGQDLYVMPASGGKARKLVTAPLVDNQKLGWTPDNSLVGYITADSSTMGKEQAWSVPVAAGQPSPITDLASDPVGLGPAYESTVQWSPDGRWVVVAGASNPMLLMRWPLSTGANDAAQEIPGGEPNWAPNSEEVLYAQTINGGINYYEVVESDATPIPSQKQYTGTGLSEYGQGPAPQWSPASSGAEDDLIAYRSRAETGEPRVALNVVGGEYQVLPLPNLTNNPSWSPSGDELVVETGHLQADPLGPKWVPDGLLIARINLTPGGAHTVTPLTRNAQWPAWGK